MLAFAPATGSQELRNPEPRGPRHRRRTYPPSSRRRLSGSAGRRLRTAADAAAPAARDRRITPRIGESKAGGEPRIPDVHGWDAERGHLEVPERVPPPWSIRSRQDWFLPLRSAQSFPSVVPMLKVYRWDGSRAGFRIRGVTADQHLIPARTEDSAFRPAPRPPYSMRPPKPSPVNC